MLFWLGLQGTSSNENFLLLENGVELLIFAEQLVDLGTVV